MPQFRLILSTAILWSRADTALPLHYCLAAGCFWIEAVIPFGSLTRILSPMNPEAQLVLQESPLPSLHSPLTKVPHLGVSGYY